MNIFELAATTFLLLSFTFLTMLLIWYFKYRSPLHGISKKMYLNLIQEIDTYETIPTEEIPLIIQLLNIQIYPKEQEKSILKVYADASEHRYYESWYPGDIMNALNEAIHECYINKWHYDPSIDRFTIIIDYINWE